MAFSVKRYGWHPSLPDKRDMKFGLQVQAMDAVPEAASVMHHCTPVYDQGALGSCTAQAGAGMVQCLRNKLGLSQYMPSRLAIYYWERLVEHTVGVDSGATIRDLMKVMASYGCPHEDMWPYDVAKFKNKPVKKVWTDGAKHKISQYMRLDNNLFQMKQCIAMGYPFVFGFAVYSSFESQEVATTGMMKFSAVTPFLLLDMTMLRKDS
jgi:C1A family cysteine protease